MEAVYAGAAAFAVFCLGQTILCWVKVAGIEGRMDAKFKDLYHHMTELEQLHPRSGNPGEPEHDGGEHPHDVDAGGFAC